MNGANVEVFKGRYMQACDNEYRKSDLSYLFETVD